MSKERAENLDIHQIEPKVFMQKGVPVFTIKNLALLAFRTTLHLFLSSPHSYLCCFPSYPQLRFRRTVALPK